ncbi:MAG TPA: tyrosine/phenylalanine carboxypeptidase domain-containing protein [Salinimicrobium sp.]|nr:tyrosine/phenylalanine carboxypeptidase domain-containing protein [Salinimicrobium sp.]
MEVSTDQELSPLSEAYISSMISELEEEGEIERHLPGGGYLHMSHELPYLVIYRLNEGDEENPAMRFALSEASFLLIGTKNYEGYQRLMFCLGEAMSTKFKSFLLFEIFSGESSSFQFKVKGPAEKLPKTLNELRENLDRIKSKFRMLPLEPAIIIDTDARQQEGKKPLLELQQLKEAGCLTLGLEVPPLYRSSEGEEYPVFFRQFKNFLIEALHKTIFEFIRVQTTSGVTSYHALGQKSIKKEALEIDHALTEIETSYQFLWLISPANIKQIREAFFESHYENVLNYHYRLLPVDPDVLKRRLFNLEIEKIDDPALSFLFREKREELDLQINMLYDRGSTNFYYNSLMLYHGIENTLTKEALRLLKEVDEEKPGEQKDLLDAWDFKKLAEEEFEYFREQDENFSSRVHLRDDVNILMVSQGELYIPADYKMAAAETKALIQHEVGTHVLTFYNGLQQPLKQLSTGLTDYDLLQEGLAVFSEYMVGGLTANRMRTLAGRVVAASALMNGSKFKEVFDLLHRKHNFSPGRAFNITSRIFQGGGFIKDIIYLKGIVELKKHIEEGGDIESLLIGKFALKHIEIIKELRERKVLKKTSLVPRYLNTEESKKRIMKIREGISLSQMINT